MHILSYVSKLGLEKAQLNLIMVVINHHNHENIGSWAMSNNHTIIGQMLQMFSRFEFQKAVNETKTIAQIYKDRWQIELFFKALKQQLKVKSFVGTSKNALLSQLWIALIAYLLLWANSKIK